MVTKYIPAGRTSLAKHGHKEFQLQTEYIRTSGPRVVTTVFMKGQVLHKIEKEVSWDVNTIEEMHHVEDIIKSQHLEVSKIIRKRGLLTPATTSLDLPQGKIRSERIRQLGEVEKIFLVTQDGKITGNREISGEFNRLFKQVVSELPEMLKVFTALPGPSHRREEGIYEVEAGRILLASTGAEFYLILVRSGTRYDAIEGKLRNILFD